MQILNKIYDFITNPTKAFEAEEKSSYKEAIKYILLLTIPAVVLSALASLAFGNLLSAKILSMMGMGKLATTQTVTLARTLILLPISYLLALIGVGISTLWLHLFALIFGAKRGIKETIKVIAYGGTPNYFFGWVPFLGFFVAIWSYILYGIGFIKLHKLSTKRAILAVLLAVLIPMFIVLILAIVLIGVMMVGFSQIP